jgi:hypothetical protein
MAIDAGYGDTNSGKTKAIERLAGHIFETTGKKTRVYIGDGGAETYNDRGLVDDGVIQMMDFSFRNYPMTVLKLMTDFWFLSDPADPNSKLVAPDLAKFYAETGLVVFEGGTVIGNWLLSDIPGGLAWHAATETGFGGVKDEDGELSYEDNVEGVGKDYKLQGINSGKHFYKAQRDVLRAIRTSKKFPGLVWWTFHPTEAADKTAGGETGQYGKITGKKIIGPDAGGKALASTLAKEFGSLLHFDQAITQAKKLDEATHKQVAVINRDFRLYTRRHFDPNQDVNIEYVAGTRMAGVKDYYSSETPGDSLLQFYTHVSQLRKQYKESRA